MSHVPNGGGLQMHSIGDTYPFTVVGTLHRYINKQDEVFDPDSTRYYILNATTGERYYFKDTFNGVERAARTWASCESAHLACERIKAGNLRGVIKLPKEEPR